MGETSLRNKSALKSPFGAFGAFECGLAKEVQKSLKSLSSSAPVVITEVVDLADARDCRDPDSRCSLALAGLWGEYQGEIGLQILQIPYGNMGGGP
jgi:hypothetical protein